MKRIIFKTTFLNKIYSKFFFAIFKIFRIGFFLNKEMFFTVKYNVEKILRIESDTVFITKYDYVNSQQKFQISKL